jgi:hypothetical protein
MNLPWSAWIAVGCGVALIAWPSTRRAPWWGLGSGLLIWTSLLLTIDPSLLSFMESDSSNSLDGLSRAGLGLAVLWSVGCGAGLNAGRDTALAHWGCLWLTVGGLVGVSCGSDWLTLGLSWEIVRRATAGLGEPSTPPRQAGAVETLGPSLGLWTAIVAWLFGTGSLDLAEIATVLQRSYAAVEPEVSLGKPAVVLQAAACLTVLSLLAPCFTAALRSTADDGNRGIATLTARQLAAVLLLLRCGRDVWLGLEAPLTWVLLVLCATAWCLAVRLVAQPSRLERLWRGVALWQLALSLTWLLAVVVQRQSVSGGLPTSAANHVSFGVLAEQWHALLVLTGLTAAVRGLSRDERRPVFLEDLRGAAREHPTWSVLMFVPLASLLGVPLLAGGWLRFLQLVTLWSLPQAGPNDTLSPHGGLVALQLVGGVAWVLLAAGLLTVVRSLVWEPPWTSWTHRRNSWSWLLAVLVAAVLLLGGFAPHVWWRE